MCIMENGEGDAPKVEAEVEVVKDIMVVENVCGNCRKEVLLWSGRQEDLIVRGDDERYLRHYPGIYTR